MKTVTPKQAEKACASVLGTIAVNIRSRREHGGITRRDLAAQCGVHEDVLQKIELAQRLPMVETLVLVSLALGVSMRDIFQTGLSDAE